jgi:hypothetical protein
METPAPVNLSALKNILANAKKVMNKIEETNSIKQKSVQSGLAESTNYDTPIYSESDEREPVYESYSPSQQQSYGQQGYTKEQVMASKLPSVIKEAMIKNPIPQLQGPPPKFTLDDLGDLVDKPKAKPRPQISESSSRQSISSDMITISKSELKEMINEGIIQFLTNNYNKALTEQAIKKTISTLLKEGKLINKK